MGSREEIQRERIQQVEEHVDSENRQDLDGIMESFGDKAQYWDEALDAHYTGHEGVRRHYEELLGALPDLHIEVVKRHVSRDQIILESEISGTHLGP